MKQTRRSHLATLLAALAAPMPLRAQTGKRVIVIGAGLAGLSAARDLQAAGADVVVVEARDRIGGRIWTSHHWPDLPMDLGASWIHGVEGNPLTELADAAGVERVADGGDQDDAVGGTRFVEEDHHLPDEGRGGGVVEFHSGCLLKRKRAMRPASTS